MLKGDGSDGTYDCQIPGRVSVNNGNWRPG